MALVPKRRISRTRRDKRRSSVWKIDAPNLVRCPRCGDYKLMHRVCGTCGYYRNREVIKKEA
ncbi:MAG TPA: 50S ribosomal protein L32 [Firmicutes bacterium]|nr:50S ribosomal protein L32 [Bacillota bacterium]